MTITGKQLINGAWVAGEAGTYQAIDPATGSVLFPSLSKASAVQVQQAVAAAAASSQFRRTSLAKRAGFLRSCAAELIALGDILVERAMAETGLTRPRIEGERGRTVAS